jgi:hypothetical protein
MLSQTPACHERDFGELSRAAERVEWSHGDLNRLTNAIIH